ncbi:RNA polymerase sigma factor [Aestuariivita boseongensis]|uniref:RNA polymerase sigma factor n=1 Tax=Aestuariivita boseongensis TaxID=1470562 RepID=UPI000A50B23B
MLRQVAPLTQMMSDDALLARYAAGDAAAASELARRHGGRLIALAWRMLNDRAEAEDVAQEAMLRLWRIAPDWESGRAQVSTWLYRVVSNLCADRLRKRRYARVGLDGIADPADPAPSADQRMQDATRDRALQEALAELPDRQRQAVILRHLEGCTNPEIAAVMEISVEAVESLTARGKRALAQALAGRRAELGFDHE